MTFMKMDTASWDAVIRTNLDSMFDMTKPVWDGMSVRGWVRIINISSVSGGNGPFGQTNYSATKTDMQGFTKALALEVARRSVTVNTISPATSHQDGHGVSAGRARFENHSANPDGVSRHS